MKEILTPELIASNPSRATFQLGWDGEPIAFRPLRKVDNGRLLAYFQTLSPETRRLYHPHPFTAELADRLCAQSGEGQTVRMVAIRSSEPRLPIVAYIILDFDVSDEDVHRYGRYGVGLSRPICRIGPSVSDALQGRGLGTVLMEGVREIARRAGCRHVILLGGVFTSNARAIRFYEKVGMRKMGTYGGENGPPSWDMLMEVSCRARPCSGPQLQPVSLCPTSQ